MTGRLLRVVVAVVVVLTSWAVGNVYGQNQTPPDTVSRAEFDAFRKEVAMELVKLRSDVYTRLVAQAKTADSRNPLLLK